MSLLKKPEPHPPSIIFCENIVLDVNSRTKPDSPGMSRFLRKASKALQADLWIQPGELAKGLKDGFDSKLLKMRESLNFTGQIHRLREMHSAVPDVRPPIPLSSSK